MTQSGSIFALCELAGSRAEVYANVLGDRSGTGGWWPLAVAMW